MHTWLKRTVTLACGSVVFASMASAEVFIRWNQAGYSPDRPIRLVIMSDTDLAEEPWTLNEGDMVLIEGKLTKSEIGLGPHTPLPFNHEVLLAPAFNAGSDLVFEVAGETAAIQVKEEPYRSLLAEPLIHLRMVRSGPDTVAPRRPSHPGDADTPVWIPDGDPTEGRWMIDPLGRRVDVEGGWYDAGDQLKFTLNTAYTVTHLLLAYNLNPELFPNPTGETLPEILEEAHHGLQWLMKVHPSDDLFVVQVGDENDHNQPLRLPEDDKLDGQRPALCALSKVHMNAAAAALASGALTWNALGRTEEARRFGNEAMRIFARANQPDTILTAFERGKTNDFYHDDSLEDQLALAATYLYRWTGDPDFLEIAVAAAPAGSLEPSWKSWHWSANFALAPYDPAAAARLQEEASRYTAYAATKGQPWGIPGRYVWGALHRWIEMAVAAQLAEGVRPSFVDSGEKSTKLGLTPLLEDMLDYVFGRNNWGVSFLFSRQLPNSLENLYSPAYGFLNLFPTGALSEGPGNTSTHLALRKHFEIAEDDPFHRFNTAEGVFFDNETDFMCQEATINGQADIVLLLTLALTR